MKKITVMITCCVMTLFAIAQNEDDKAAVQKACLNYIEGFYEGDTVKLIQSLRPGLYKAGYYKNAAGNYVFEGNMSYRQALDYATRVFAKKNFAKPNAPKKVELLDTGHAIAAAKVTAWWGIDYILLSKQEGKWMIEQVLWEGPLSP